MKLELLDEFGKRWAEISPLTQGIIESIAVIVLSVLMRAAIVALVRKRSADPRSIYTWRKGTQYFFTIFALTMIISIWFQGTSDVATFLGLLSAGVAVALKDPLANLVGWAFVLWQRPFSVGDRVEIRGMIGDVVDQRFFSFTMLEVGNWTHGEQSTGRVLHVPNSHVFAHPLFNYTEPFNFIWDEIAVVVTFESDWALAKQLLTQIVNEHSSEIIPEAKRQLEDTSKRSLISYTNLSPIVYTSVVDVGVKLAIRYLTPTRRRRGAQNELWEAILTELSAQECISLSYPTQRVVADGVAQLGPSHGAQLSKQPKRSNQPATPSEPTSSEE
jgi:small-conductance mechanosensitive channel